METTLKIAVVFLPLLYLLLAVSYAFLFFTGDKRAKVLAKPLLLSTLTLHMGYLLLLAVRWQQFPAATLSQALSLVAFAVAAVYAFVEWRGREASTGFWMLAVAFLFELLSSLLRSQAPPDREIFHNPLFAIHVSLGVFGYAAFVIAAGYGFFFLRLYHEIKRRRFSTFFGKLPPLEVLERMMMAALLAGFAALTGAVAAGAIWAEQIFGHGWLEDPKIGVTVAVWGFYGLALLLRRIQRWQARQTAVASLAGFAAILFSFVAVNLFFTQLHGFY